MRDQEWAQGKARGRSSSTENSSSESLGFLSLFMDLLGEEENVYRNFAKLREQCCAIWEVKRPTKQQVCLQQLVTMIKGTGAKTQRGNGTNQTLSGLQTGWMSEISSHSLMCLSCSLRLFYSGWCDKWGLFK